MSTSASLELISKSCNDELRLVLTHAYLQSYLLAVVTVLVLGVCVCKGPIWFVMEAMHVC